MTEQFRLRQQLMPQRSWSSIDQDMWTLYVASPPQHSFALKGVAFNNAPNRASQSSSSIHTQANLHQQQWANRNRGAKNGKNTSVTKPGFLFQIQSVHRLSNPKLQVHTQVYLLQQR